MLAALPPRAARPPRLPADRADQAGGAGDRRPSPAHGREEAREPGPLLPRRSGQAQVPAPPRRPQRQRGHGPRRRRQRRRHATPATTTSPSASAAASASPPPSRSTSLATDAVANTVTVGTREELETRRVHVRDATLHRDGARVDAVRLRYHSRALPASIGAAGPGRHDALEIELGEEFVGASPGSDRGAARGRDDRRPRHDRRRGLTRSTRPSVGQAPSVSEIFRLPHMKAQEIRRTYL